MKTLVQTAELAAVLIAAGKHDVRRYINSVYIEPIDGKGAILAATDGHRLHAVRSCDSDTVAGSVNPAGKQFGLIIPRESIELITKGGKAAHKLFVAISYDNGMVTLSRSDGLTVSTPPIDDRYPEIYRIIPPRHTVETGGDTAQFNPAYIMDAEKAAKTLRCGRSAYIHVHHNGNSGALVTSSVCPEFLAVVMPVRSGGFAIRANIAYESLASGPWPEDNQPDADMQAAA